MTPLCLIFSSDSEASRGLQQGLEQLGFQTQACREIFAAIEKLSNEAYEIVVADWDEGAEAAFLLETCRSLKANHNAFTIALVPRGRAKEAASAGAHHSLLKPLLEQEVITNLLQSPEFAARLRRWTQNLPVSPLAREPQPATTASTDAIPVSAVTPRVSLTFATGDDLFAKIRRGKLRRRNGRSSDFQSETLSKGMLYTVLASSIALVVMIGSAYVFGSTSNPQALAKPIVNASYAVSYRVRAFAKLFSDEDEEEGAIAAAQRRLAASQQASLLQPHRSRVRTILAAAEADQALTEPLDGGTESTEAVANAAGSELGRFSNSHAVLAAAAAKPVVPVSLREADPVANLAPAPISKVSLASAVATDPVHLPESLSRDLLLQQVPPTYPVQALQSGAQGPVVLMARIGRDGSVSDLKMMQGPMLLASSACSAVKQWKFKPYAIDGRVVEAQTLITVNFQLP